MNKKRRNKKKGFGLINTTLCLAILIGTFVVTQTNALQYLKGKLADGEPATEVAVSQEDSVKVVADSGSGTSVSAEDGEEKNLKSVVTLQNVVAGKMKKGQLLEKTGYVSYFNFERNNPDWVAWELTAKETEGRLDRKGYGFIPDEQLPKVNQVTTYDYKDSGYDRGHMCPAADMKWAPNAMHDCFYLSNICPQVPELNQRSWERLESACRRWAAKMGSIYIVCGPIYKQKTPEYIGLQHRVAVPDAFFKVVVSLKKGKEKGVAFYYENTEEYQPMAKAVRSIDQIEKLTKYDFFSELPDDIEDRIEAETDLTSFEKTMNGK